MNNETCTQIQQLLVDYSDGLLPSEQVQQTDAHLANCSVCREELYFLERSLELAQEVWNESGTVPSFVPTKMGLSLSPSISGKKEQTLPPRKIAWIAGSLAVCAAVILISIWQTMFLQSKSANVAPQPKTIAQNNPTQSSTVQPKEEFDVMEYIAREDRSARLAASVEILAGQPTLHEYKENAERYLRQTYPDTVAVQLLSKQ
jgi:hypothetical protein